MAQFTDAQINEYVQANIGNPQAIADAAQQYGVSAADLSRATGYDAGTVSNYFSNAGINFGQPAALPPVEAPVAAPVDYAAQQFQPDSYANYEPAYMGIAPQQADPVAPAVQTPPPPATGVYNPVIQPPEAATYDPTAVQQRIIQEERKRNLEGGLASLGAGLSGQDSSSWLHAATRERRNIRPRSVAGA